eukprot:324323-Heterocapsa_arctica.AAC.1
MEKHRSCELRLLRFNPKTFRRVVKRSVIQKQLKRAAVHVAGFPESRYQRDDIAQSDSYCIVHSACLPYGSGGGNIWFAKSLPFVSPPAPNN